MLRKRRLRSLLLTALVAGFTWMSIGWTSRTLGDESTVSGVVLLVATLSLYLLTLRKRTTSTRLGKVSAWLQFHAYAGVFAGVVFLMHIHWPIRGPFELCLAVCFTFVSVTGIILGILSRLTPVRLAAVKQDITLEQIPHLRFVVARDAHETAISSTKLGEGATLSEYYQHRLLPYFQTSRSGLYHLFPTGAKRRQLLRELKDIDRYLAADGLRHRKMLSAMVQSRDDLDFHYALQTRLRYFYALHCALTWTLLILIGVHIVLVFRFSGAML